MAKTWEERGPYGRWLVTARLARKLKRTEDGRAAVTATGAKIGKSAYAQYESGSKVPSRNHLPLLEDYWGPFSDPVGATEPPDDLAGMVQAQTDAINALVTEMRLAHGEQAAALRGVEKALQAVAKARTPAGS